MRARGRTLALALVVSAGLLVGAVLLLDAPGDGGQGIPHALPQPELAAAGERGAPPVPDPAPGAAERYYRKAEVDVPAVPVSRVPLVIPERAYYSRLAGKVRARVFIGADGGVDRVDILEAGPVRGLFERPALDALRRMHYRPASIGGRAVRSQKVVEVVFDPRADDPHKAQ